MVSLFGGTRLGSVGGSVLSLLLLVGTGLASAPLAAADAVSATDGGKRFAVVSRVRGEVFAAPGTGKERALKEGDPVHVGERVRAAAVGEAVLKTDDAGIVAVRPNTEFIAERYAAEDKPTDSLTVRLVTGSLRVISGWIARTNRSGHNIVTPSATIGIRGTDHEPYVLSAELATATNNKEGTYDKVNRGGTTMQVGEAKLDIDPGKVGFVRAPAPVVKENKSGFKERALLTILMPVLLDKVPNFYVPGAFDAELDRYSQTADQESLKLLEQRRKAPPAPAPASPPAPPAPPAAATAAVSPAPPTAASAPTAAPGGACAPTVIAKNWLGQLDGAIAKGNAQAIIAMFGADVGIRANVKGNEGKLVSVDINRDEFAKSTITAMKGLKNYKQRRVWTEGRLAGAGCERIGVKSVVIEQGRQAGKPYRFESLEDFVLELRDGKWLAVRAETTQQ